jgi:Ca-activated chloride channel homolog
MNATSTNLFGEHAPRLISTGGIAPALQGVCVQGQIQGLLMQLQVQQHYENTSSDEVEVAYTFPVAYDAVLLGVSAQINGKQLTGQVLPKTTATDRYENAVVEGDTPVMVELAEDGMYTANLGNLLPGERCTLEITIGQVLRLEQGQIRLAIPTTVAPRYGDAQLQGGLAPHQNTDARLGVHYGFDLNIELLGALAQGTVTCPSHQVCAQTTEQGLRVRLQQDAALDRDFILVLSDLAAQYFAIAQPTDQGHVAMLSFTPEASAVRPRPLCLKVLVDCSGSMAGDSIAQARSALHVMGQELSGSDMVSLTRFGSRTEHMFSQMMPATTALRERQWLAGINRMEADLGGTELASALQHCFEIARPRHASASGPVDLLLITDGSVWDTTGSVEAALRSGHRIFAVGVGSAVSEGLLRQLAEATGGACEFVSPTESITAAVMRVFHRLRRGQSTEIQVNWGSEPKWQSALPTLLVPGETIHMFAELTTAPKNVIGVTYQLGTHEASSHVTPVTFAQVEWLSRAVGARRFKECSDGRERAALAQQHNLVSEYTNLLLVYERADDAKANGMPTLAPTPQMLAAGWAGTTIVLDMHHSIDRSSSHSSFPRVWFSHQTNTSATSVIHNSLEDFEIPEFLRKDDPRPGSSHQKAEPSNAGAIKKPSHPPAPTKLQATNGIDALELLWAEMVDAAMGNTSADEVLKQAKSYDQLSSWIDDQLNQAHSPNAVLAMLVFVLHIQSKHLDDRQSRFALASHLVRQIRHLAQGFPTEAVSALESICAGLLKDSTQI